MEPAKQLLWRELLLWDVAAPEPPSFFVTRPTCAAFQRGAPGCVVLDHLLTAKGLQSGPEAQGGRFAEAPRELPGEPWELSASRPISPGQPRLSPVRLAPSRERPDPLSVERVVVRPRHLVFGTSNPAQKESVRTGQKLFSYQPRIRFVWWTKKTAGLSLSNET